MVIRFGLMLVVVGSLFLGAAQKCTNAQDRAKCLEKCQKNCETTYSNCMKKAGANPQSCVGSRDLCKSVCANKTCPSN